MTIEAIRRGENEPFKLPKHYGVTWAYLVFRVAERFGLDPWRIAEEWSAEQIIAASDYNQVRECQELQELEISTR